MTVPYAPDELLSQVCWHGKYKLLRELECSDRSNYVLNFPGLVLVGSVHSAFPTMAAPTTSQSVFRHPLTTALSGEGAVRIMREMSRHGGPLSPRAIADRAGLTVQGARRVLKRLATLGLIEGIGTGDRLLFQASAGHPLRPALDALFAAEAARVDAVFAAIRSAARGVTPAPRAVWLYGSVARGEDTAASDLDVVVVVDTHDPSDVEVALGRMREALVSTEETQRVVLSLVGLSLADAARLAQGDAWWSTLVADAVPLIGPAPAAIAAQATAEGRAGRAAPQPPHLPAPRGRRRSGA